jgi:hypothetical protein
MLVDAAIVVESFAVALLIRLDGEAAPPFWGPFWSFAILAAAAFVVLLRVRPLRVARATATATGGLLVASLAMGPDGFGLLYFTPVPLSVILIGALLAYPQLVAVRLLPRAPIAP